VLHTDKTNSRIPIRSNQNKYKDNIDKYYKTMTKLIDSILTRRLSHEFIKTYPNLHYIWNSFVNMNHTARGNILRFFQKANLMDHCMLGWVEETKMMNVMSLWRLNIDTNIVYDQNFLVSSIVPNHFINAL
jgi:hypothetical protein